MKYAFVLLIFPLVAAHAAETREFARPCTEVYPRAAQFLTGKDFEVVTSDATGGLLTMKWSGPAMGPFHKGVKQLFNEYVVNGEKQRAGVTLLYTVAFPMTPCRCHARR